MTNQIGFNIDTTVESFLDWFNWAYSEVNPRSIQSFTTTVNFSDELVVLREADTTLLFITATDDITDILLPIISISIEPNEDNGLYIFAEYLHYHVSLADDLLQDLLSMLARKYEEAEISTITMSETLTGIPPKIWKGEKFGLIAEHLGIHHHRLFKMIRIEDEYVPARLTQKEMAKELKQSEETIKDDIAFMKKHPEYFPKTAERFLKTTP